MLGGSIGDKHCEYIGDDLGGDSSITHCVKLVIDATLLFGVVNVKNDDDERGKNLL